MLKVLCFLECTQEQPVPLLVKEPTAHYLCHSIEEENHSLHNFWPRLTQGQHTAMLKLLDSFLE